MIDEQKLRELATAAMNGVEVACEMLSAGTENGEVILALLDELATLRSERTAWRVTAENAEKDAARYRRLRRGQHWSVINGIGGILRADELDSAIDHSMDETP